MTKDTLWKILKKTVRFVFGVFVCFVAIGVVSVMFDRSILPRLAVTAPFDTWGFMRHSVETTTVVNKTEQLIVGEDDAVEKIVSQPETTVVNIVVVSGEDKVQKVSTVGNLTGVLLTNDGLIASYAPTFPLSANGTFTAILFDGTTMGATFLGIDRLTNLVFFKIDQGNVPAISIANSEDARVGKKLIALGVASGAYQDHVALGVLENIDRSFNLSGKTVASSEKWEGVFNMSLPLPGEAFVGGPVVDFNGEMLGIVGTLVIDNAPRFFLIPSNAVRTSMDKAVGGTLSDRPTLGAYYLSLTPAYAIGHNSPRDHGALIFSSTGKTGLAVLAGSAAEKAGLLANDVVLSVNNTAVDLEHPFSVLLGQFHKGDAITLTVLRAGKEVMVSVVLQ